jgi:predicted metal-dependent phosphoesterase TrpH
VRLLVIDLHLHTTASDGRLTPGELVDRARAAGVAVLAVTDHDTMASFQEVRARGGVHGVETLPGIEVTAVDRGRDVHVLGYFLDPDDPELIAFLARQRQIRVDRVRRMAARLAELGAPIDAEALLGEAARQPGRSIGRPQVARALQRAGHVADTQEAFDRYLAGDAPAFVARPGSPPEDVVAIIHRAGGLGSLAHPGRTRVDHRLGDLARAGLDALEVYHPDHDAAAVERYARTAGELGLLVTGGSDFHGEPTRASEPGAAVLPAAEWERLRAARHRHARR